MLDNSVDPNPNSIHVGDMPLRKISVKRGTI